MSPKYAALVLRPKSEQLQILRQIAGQHNHVEVKKCPAPSVSTQLRYKPTVRIGRAK